MSFINYAAREINCKLVYYGPGLSGKTTNVEYIFHHTREHSRGRLVSLKTDAQRTLFFDFLPLSLGTISGFRVRFHLYTVPGQVFYNASREIIIRGLDGIVFVADSHQARMDANQESMSSLHINLDTHGMRLADLPLVLQCNKRDIRDPAPMDEIQRCLGLADTRPLAAVAIRGVGVFETLKALSKAVLRRLGNAEKTGQG